MHSVWSTQSSFERLQEERQVRDLSNQRTLYCSLQGKVSFRIDNDDRGFLRRHIDVQDSPKAPAEPKSKNPSASQANKEDEPADATILNVTEKSALLTTTATIVNKDTGRTIKARLIFDTASQRSYITNEATDVLKLRPLHSQNHHVSVFGSKKTRTVTANVVSFGIIQKDGSTKTIVAHSTPVVTGKSIRLPDTLSEQNNSLLHSMKYALANDIDDPKAAVDIPIGCEYFWEFINGCRIQTPTGLLFIPSTGGLLLGGRYQCEAIENSSDNESTLLCLTETSLSTPSSIGRITTESKIQPNYPDIDEYWNLEKIGITDDPVECDDDKALAQFNESEYHVEGRYRVKWPWIEDNKARLPVNRELTLGRLKSLLKRLRNGDKSQVAELPTKYQEEIDAQIEKGIIERVSSEEVSNPKYTAHYLPHHPVLKLSSATTKVRMVYDASAKLSRDNVSLNECIYRGPVILPHLYELLIRFRCNEIAIISDVEKVFLQMALQQSERDATRFIWLDDPTKLTVDNNMAIYRFCRVPFGVIASPFLLGATIQHHLRKYVTDDENSAVAKAAEIIARDVHVDNITVGAKNENEAVELQKNMVKLFGDACMNLQEFCSNSNILMAQVPTEKHAPNRLVKMLGLMLNSENDTLGLVKRNFQSDLVTKRIMLRTVASIFDPLGLYQPITLPDKCLLQRLWQLELGWDDPILPDLQETWKDLAVQFRDIFAHTIPRFVGSVESLTKVQIIVFCDASAKCYATAVYLHIKTSNNEYATNLVFSKSRLAPKMKTITMPRLELLAVVIGVKAGEFVRKAIHPKGGDELSMHVFTDSEIVLNWLRTSRLLAKFICDRVNAIKSARKVTFHHVRSEDNPADYCTRGKSTNELLSCSQWWSGPAWLPQSIEHWPKTNLDSISADKVREMEQEYRSAPICHTFVVGSCDAPEFEKFLDIDITRFSTLQKLLGVSVLVDKFLKKRVWEKLCDRTKAKYPKIAKTLDIIEATNSHCTTCEIRTMKDSWVKATQDLHYADVFEAIKTKKKHHLVQQLGLMVDENEILRSHSRFDHADMPFDVRCPKLMPKKSRLCELIIMDVHRKLLHSGVSHTLSQVRREFWIPQGRPAIKHILNKCIICQKHHGPSFSLPMMPPWPRERMVQQAPFQSTGLDYLGPISTKIGDSVHKMWICLFTCLVTRAIYLEVVTDCTAKEFLNCFIRFVSRRGTPQLLISDNAPQFRTTKTELDRAWHRVMTDETVRTFSSDRGIEWRFTIELAPWQGGFYERLVQVVKRTLEVEIGRRLLAWQELVTLVTEVEAIANTRPITYILDDHNSKMLSIRPVDFLTDLLVSHPDIEESSIDSSRMGEATKRLVAFSKYRRKKQQKIWDLWYDEYLLSLRERGQSKHRPHRPEVQSHPRPNEIVVLRDDDHPRGMWKLAKVLRIVRSSDSQIRAVELELPNREVIRRTINFFLVSARNRSGSGNRQRSCS